MHAGIEGYPIRRRRPPPPRPRPRPRPPARASSFAASDRQLLASSGRLVLLGAAAEREHASPGWSGLQISTTVVVPPRRHRSVCARQVWPRGGSRSHSNTPARQQPILHPDSPPAALRPSMGDAGKRGCPPSAHSASAHPQARCAHGCHIRTRNSANPKPAKAYSTARTKLDLPRVQAEPGLPYQVTPGPCPLRDCPARPLIPVSRPSSRRDGVGAAGTPSSLVSIGGNVPRSTTPRRAPEGRERGACRSTRHAKRLLERWKL